MKKVLFFVESLGGGGAEKVLVTIIEHLDKSVFDITVCSVIDGGIYADEVKRYARYCPLLPPFQSQSFLGKFFYRIKYQLIYRLPVQWIYKLWIPKGRDVEIAYIEGFATKVIAHSSNLKAKRLAWVHCNMLKQHWTRRFFKNDEDEKLCYEKYDRVITVSQVQKQSLREVFGELPVHVLYNPVDSNRMREMSIEPISLELKDDVYRLVSVGRLESVKGYDRLLRVFKSLIECDYPVELWLIGEGSEKEALQYFVDKNNLQEYVKLLGFCSNPYKYVSRCDLFVCSSYSEGFSTAITEALVLGIPVVSTDVSGVDEQLIGECGLITSNDEHALLIGIKEALYKEKLDTMKEAAFERGQKFQLEFAIKSIEEYIK